MFPVAPLLCGGGDFDSISPGERDSFAAASRKAFVALRGVAELILFSAMLTVYELWRELRSPSRRRFN